MGNYGDYAYRPSQSSTKETHSIQSEELKNNESIQSVETDKIKTISKPIFEEKNEKNTKKLAETQLKKVVSSDQSVGENQEKSDRVAIISKPILEDKERNITEEKTSTLVGLEKLYEENSKKISMLTERIETLKESGIDKEKEQIPVLVKLKESYEQKQEGIKLKIQEEIQDSETISKETEVAEKEEILESEQEKIEEESRASEEAHTELGEMYAERAAKIRAEIQEGNLTNIYTVIKSRLEGQTRLEQLKTPINSSEAKETQKTIKNNDIIHFKNGVLTVPEHLKNKFKVGEKVEVKYPDGSIGKETILRIEIFSKKELKQLKKDIQQFVLAPIIKQSTQQTQQESKPPPAPPPIDLKQRPSTVAKPESTKKAERKQEKTLEKMFTQESINTERYKANLARLQKNKEKIELKIKILKKFIQKWNENDENLTSDLKNQEVLQEFVNKYKIKTDSVRLDEVVLLSSQELKSLENDLSKNNNKIEKIKITLEKPQNLKRSVP